MEDRSGLDDLVPVLRFFIIQVVFPAPAVNLGHYLFLLELERALLPADFLKHDVYTAFSLLFGTLFIQFSLGLGRDILQVKLLKIRLVSWYV